MHLATVGRTAEPLMHRPLLLGQDADGDVHATDERVEVRAEQRPQLSRM